MPENGSFLSQQDLQNLAEFAKKSELIRDRVRGVVGGRQPGFFLGGRGGIGKSHTVADELNRLHTPYVLSNSHLTGRKLAELLKNNPDAVHVIDDVEDALRDPQAIGVLKSALGGMRRNRQGQLERWITWGASGATMEFPFCGGIIMTSNLELQQLPRLQALKTRISWYELQVSDWEIEAMMRKIAQDGYPAAENQLDPQQCLEVVEFILSEAARVSRTLDLRLLTNCFEDRLQAEDHEAALSWQDLVASRVHERASIVGSIQSCSILAKRKAAELEIAREIVTLETEERFRVWQDRTRGASRSTMYRRLSELAQADALVFEH